MRQIRVHLYMHTCVCVYISISNTYDYVCMYVRMHACIYVSICLSIHLSSQQGSYMSIYLSIYLSIYPSICLSILMHACMHTRSGRPSRLWNPLFTILRVSEIRTKSRRAPKALRRGSAWSTQGFWLKAVGDDSPLKKNRSQFSFKNHL